jgi:hypothetical protein
MEPWRVVDQCSGRRFASVYKEQDLDLDPDTHESQKSDPDLHEGQNMDSDLYQMMRNRNCGKNKESISLSFCEYCSYFEYELL